MPLRIGQLLNMHRKARNLSLKDIERAARRLEDLPRAMGRSAAFFSNLETGHTDVRPEWLAHIARVYEIDGLLLMFNLPEPVPGAVTLDVTDDFQTAPWRDPLTRGAEYSIAKYRLADSDLILVFLTLQPGGRSRPKHWHPGDEVIMVEKGQVILVRPHQPPSQRETPLREGQICHFDSDVEHLLENRTTQPATVFIMRQFAAPGAAPPDERATAEPERRRHLKVAAGR